MTDLQQKIDRCKTRTSPISAICKGQQQASPCSEMYQYGKGMRRVMAEALGAQRTAIVTAKSCQDVQQSSPEAARGRNGRMQATGSCRAP